MKCRLFRVKRIELSFWKNKNISIKNSCRVIVECEGRYYYPSWQGWKKIEKKVKVRFREIPSFIEGGIEVDIPAEVLKKYFYPIKKTVINCRVKNYGIECFYDKACFDIEMPQKVVEFIRREIKKISIRPWIMETEERSYMGRIRKVNIFVPIPLQETTSSFC